MAGAPFVGKRRGGQACIGPSQDSGGARVGPSRERNKDYEED